MTGQVFQNLKNKGFEEKELRYTRRVKQIYVCCYMQGLQNPGFFREKKRPTWFFGFLFIFFRSILYLSDVGNRNNIFLTYHFVSSSINILFGKFLRQRPATGRRSSVRSVGSPRIGLPTCTPIFTIKGKKILETATTICSGSCQLCK